jgi:hypothetical protein
MTHLPTSTPSESTRSPAWWDRPATAVVSVVAASTALAVMAPDMVTGSEQEHLPLAALTIWPWTAAAIGYVVMAGRGRSARDLVVSVSLTWVLVAVVAIAVPSLITGTDPTQIPLAALVAPPFGAVATGFLAIAHARSDGGQQSWSAPNG